MAINNLPLYPNRLNLFILISLAQLIGTDTRGNEGMNIIKIVNDGLKLNGYSGLYQSGTCGCKIDDLSPGNCLDENCEPGYCHAHSTKNLWVIHQQKEPISDDVIEEISDY